MEIPPAGRLRAGWIERCNPFGMRNEEWPIDAASRPNRMMQRTLFPSSFADAAARRRPRYRVLFRVEAWRRWRGRAEPKESAPVDFGRVAAMEGLGPCYTESN